MIKCNDNVKKYLPEQIYNFCLFRIRNYTVAFYLKKRGKHLQNATSKCCIVFDIVFALRGLWLCLRGEVQLESLSSICNCTIQLRFHSLIFILLHLLIWIFCSTFFMTENESAENK